MLHAASISAADVGAGAASLLTGMVTAKVRRKVARFFAGFVPGVGSAVNVGTAASITEGVGWAAVAYFDK